VDEAVIMLLAGSLLAASIVIAQWAYKLGVSFLVAFLVLGMLLGSEGIVGIKFDNAEMARTIGIISLVLILFEGGISTSWRRLRNVAWSAAFLSTVGVLVTAVLTGIFAKVIFHLPWLESFLLGSVVSSTDAAAVFATLRFTNIKLRVARVLEAETGLNDPMAIALTVGLIAWVQQPAYDVTNLAALLFHQIGLGLVVGLVLGYTAVKIFSHLPQNLGAFAPVASLSVCALSYGIAGVLGGSGFLAVYLVGLAIGSTPSRYRHQIVSFHEGTAFLAQVILFIVLGLLVFPKDLASVAWQSLFLAAILVVLVRPIAVFSAISLSSFSIKEKTLIGYAGLRGAVPIVLGTFVLTSPLTFRSTIFNAVFFIVLISALVQGATLEKFAKWLGVIEHYEEEKKPRAKHSAETIQIVMEYEVSPYDSISGVKVKEIGLPKPSILTAIKHGRRKITPTPETVINPYDLLFVLTTNEQRMAVEDVISRWQRRV
jgi:cell volume regulation protein A